MTMGLSDIFSIVATAFLSVGGAGALIVALWKFFGERVAERWLEGVKASYATELAHVQHQLDRLGQSHQAQLDHAVTVSRVQFEEEFRSFREVWNFVARARATALAIVEKVPLDDSPEWQRQRFVNACRDFGEAHRKLVLAIDNNSPFYPEFIYQTVDAFRFRTAKELSQLETRKPFESEWLDQRADVQQETVALADVVSSTIRKRLASIVILEGPGRLLSDVSVGNADKLPAPSEGLNR